MKHGKVFTEAVIKESRYGERRETLWTQTRWSNWTKTVQDIVGYVIYNVTKFLRLQDKTSFLSVRRKRSQDYWCSSFRRNKGKDRELDKTENYQMFKDGIVRQWNIRKVCGKPILTCALGKEPKIFE